MISYNIKSIRKKPLILINLGYFFFLILLLFGCGQNIDNHGHYDKIKKEVRKQKSQIHKLQINSPSKPVIAWMDSKQNSNYQIKWNMWWGINGNNAVLIENNKEIEKQKLSPKGFNGQQGSFQFINKKSGLYEYRVKLS